MSNSKELNFKIQLDGHHLPEKIEWSAESDAVSKACKSVMIALWDETERSTLRIDLWTKDMSVDEMRVFYHQNVLSLADAYARATGDHATTSEVKQYLETLGKKMGILS